MAPSDLEQLLDMGFERPKAELAAKNTGGLQEAIDWLEKHQDQSVEEIQETLGAAASSEQSASQEAKSLVCNECGTKLRNAGQAEFHASKTGHTDFAESVEEIAPLTEDEKKQKLADLRAKLATKRAAGSEQDKADKKRNEEIRRKSTKEVQDVKEDLQKKEQIKEAAAKRKEKQADLDAKARIKAKIEADKEERRLKAEKEKAEREGRMPAIPTAEAPVAATPTTSKPASAYTETRLRLQSTGQSIQQAFPVDSTLFEVASAIKDKSGLEVSSFSQNYPKKTFDAVDFGATLKELGLVPSASLIFK